ncbi:hypothetical protein JD844_029165 [Phrynosoma platyrhinos]|uniref:Leptin n=1 Tax=Phrynosoma platyrhinos TaxID=52577 RepID=A0ABQ7SIX9_PHRPL|nr:hypothetical protein JD844_029165 [Phrynosoma platyrhinos]
MHCPSIPLLCFLWAWLPLSHSQSLELNKILDDMESLTEIIIARIQEQQVRLPRPPHLPTQSCPCPCPLPLPASPQSWTLDAGRWTLDPASGVLLAILPCSGGPPKTSGETGGALRSGKGPKIPLKYFPSDSMRVIDATLGIFHQVLSTLPSEASVNQISNDIENLRSLLQLLAAELGCPYERSSSDDALSNLTDLLTISPYTTTIVTMDRLQKCLRSLPSLFRHGQHC